MPSRTPRRPSIGFISCSSFTFCSTRLLLGDVVALGLAERDLDRELDLVGQELVQRRVEQAHRDRQPAHRREDADEVAPLQRQQHVVGGLLLVGGLGEDHLAHGEHAFLAEEHVLGAAQPDALGAALAGVRRLVGGVGVGAHPQRRRDRRRSSSALERAPQRRSARAASSPCRAFSSSELLQRQLADEDVAA